MIPALYKINTLSWILYIILYIIHIILILSQPVFALSPLYCVLSREATNAKFIVFALTRTGLEPTIYRTQGEHGNHYTTGADASIVKPI